MTSDSVHHQHAYAPALPPLIRRGRLLSDVRSKDARGRARAARTRDVESQKGPPRMLLYTWWGNHVSSSRQYPPLGGDISALRGSCINVLHSASPLTNIKRVRKIANWASPPQLPSGRLPKSETPSHHRALTTLFALNIGHILCDTRPLGPRLQLPPMSPEYCLVQVNKPLGKWMTLRHGWRAPHKGHCWPWIPRVDYCTPFWEALPGLLGVLCVMSHCRRPGNGTEGACGKMV